MPTWTRQSRRAVVAFSSNSGQICSAGTRLFVHESLHRRDDRARRALAAVTQKVGSPMAETRRSGPLISGRQMERVLSYVDEGPQRGEPRLKRAAHAGSDRSVTLWSRRCSAASPTSMTIAREEIFGPVLSIISVQGRGRRRLQGNDTEYGLAAAVWTRDASRAHRVARALKGRPGLDQHLRRELIPSCRSGGYKQSGYGREMGAGVHRGVHPDQVRPDAALIPASADAFPNTTTRRHR
jgi:acyl-CoA reductase-like NAD-dependent aldehyde dehydrogenase